jgi:hypothetical protein
VKSVVVLYRQIKKEIIDNESIIIIVYVYSRLELANDYGFRGIKYGFSSWEDSGALVSATHDCMFAVFYCPINF